jgi:hypothetical protein
MSFWRHNICEACWQRLHSDQPEPLRLIPQLRDDVKCCFCGNLNRDGIYTRENGRELRCKGHCG